jgi:hypothetical protein
MLRIIFACITFLILSSIGYANSPSELCSNGLASIPDNRGVQYFIEYPHINGRIAASDFYFPAATNQGFYAAINTFSDEYSPDGAYI